MTYRYSARYRTWYRPSGSTIPRPVAIGAAVVVAGAMASGIGPVVHHHHHHHGGIPAASIPAAPSAIAWSRAAWAKAFLRGIPEPVTSCNLSAVVAWETREGGGFGNQAGFQRAERQPRRGRGLARSPRYWRVGVSRRRDRPGATRCATSNNGYYGGILTALHDGHSAQGVLDAVMASPWAQSHYSGTLGASC